MPVEVLRTEEYLVDTEPYYRPTGNEVDLFESAFRGHIPVLLKGPTGCGKTRFMMYMAWKFAKPLITVSCHDDLTTSDLVGRYLSGEERPYGLTDHSLRRSGAGDSATSTRSWRPGRTRQW